MSVRHFITRNSVASLAVVLVGFLVFAGRLAANPNASAGEKAKATMIDGWKLVQKAQEGEYHLWVTRDAVRAYCVRHGYSVIACAPVWDVYVVDTNKEIYSKVTWHRFETQGLLDFFQPIPLPTGKERTTQKIDISGIAATAIMGKYPQNDPNIKAEAVTNRFMLGTERKVAPVLDSFKYTVTDRLGTSKNVNTVLRIIYGLPAIDQFPIAYLDRKVSGEVGTVLTTNSIVKAKVSDDNFKVNLKFRFVKRPLDVVYKARSQEMNDIFDGLGVGTEFGSAGDKKKKAK